MKKHKISCLVTFWVAVLFWCLVCTETLQARVQNCRRTNKKPFRYCLDRVCTSNRDCRSNEQCLCDGDCGLSCVRNGTDCGKPEISKAVRVRYSSGTKFQSVASFQCKGRQYRLRGSKKRVCRGIGKWDGRSAKCRILCKHPGGIAFANNDGDKTFYRVGNTVRYWCFPGYDMEGARVVKCNKRGKWNKPLPKCTTPSCSKPTPPDNAYIYSRRKLKEKYRFNEVVLLRCKNGYYPSGSAFQRCLSTGWTKLRFTCTPKSCGDPGTPINGKRIGNLLTFKNKVYFTCNRGYLRVGPEYRQCQSNQKWSDELPICEILCPNPGVPTNGNVENSPLPLGKHGSRITFRCNDKYVLQGQRTLECQGGQWSGEIPKCLAPCKNPGIPYGGVKHGTSYRHNEQVMFKCKGGMVIHGARTLTCNNGVWDNDTPKCLARCVNPGVPKNGYPEKPLMRFATAFKHGTALTFLCNDTHTLQGQQTIKCTDGRWSHELPKCLASCQDPGTPDGGKRHGNNFRHNDKVRFACKFSKTMEGAESITCNDGQWSDSPPKCIGFFKKICQVIVPWCGF